MRRWLMALNLLVCSSAAGCAMFEQRAEYLHYETVLEDGKTVRLMEYSQINQALRGPANNYAIAVLHVLSSRGAMLWTERVAFREGIDAMPAFDPKDVEVRTDDAHRRLWFIDRPNERILATLDLDGLLVTGEDDPVPPWAGLDMGARLSDGRVAGSPDDG
jgi:hypothetical protein